MNSCYASIECSLNPDLKGKPMAVGGNEASRHGIILAKSEEAKAEMLMATLYEYYLKHFDKLPQDLKNLVDKNGDPKERIVCDYVGAMTDRFAIAMYEELYIPKSWHG